MKKHTTPRCAVRWLACLLVLLAAVSCHDDAPARETTVRVLLHANTEMLPPHEEHVESRGPLLPDVHDVRYTLRIYRTDGPDADSRTACRTHVLTADKLTGHEAAIDLSLPAGRYRFLAWADYVDEGSTAHKYYNTDHFEEVSFHGPYQGSTEYRDAFYGSTEAEVGAGTGTDIALCLQRPHAKYRLVATDLPQFVLKEQEQFHAPAGTITHGTTLSDYRAHFQYTQFVPCAFNLFTGKPADSRPGLGFECPLEHLANGEVVLGFDYVMLDEGEHPLPEVVVTVTDLQGRVVNRLVLKGIPLLCNRTTTLRGKFLTEDMSGGLVINPGFGGDIDVPWQP